MLFVKSRQQCEVRPALNGLVLFVRGKNLCLHMIDRQRKMCKVQQFLVTMGQHLCRPNNKALQTRIEGEIPSNESTINLNCLFDTVSAILLTQQHHIK